MCQDIPLLYGIHLRSKFSKHNFYYNCEHSIKISQFLVSRLVNWEAAQKKLLDPIVFCASAPVTAFIEIDLDKPTNKQTNHRLGSNLGLDFGIVFKYFNGIKCKMNKGVSF